MAMTTFTGTSAIALTWSADGHCRGLSVRRHRDTCRIVATWHSEPRPDRGVNEALAEGLRHLGGHESTVVVASGEDLSCGVIDLQTPKLKAEELRNALAFEIKRNAPVADEKLAWAYRILPDSSANQQHVRLYYLRQAVWERWLNDISGLVHGVDMMIPPAAALDPVLAGTSVALGQPGNAFVFVPTDEHRREGLLLEEGEDEEGFGLGPDPLATPMLDATVLQDLTVEARRAFTGCAILGMYALSHTFLADRRTGLELPFELRPRRHRNSRLIAVALALYTLIVGSFGAVRLYQARQAQFSRLHTERVRIEADVAKIGKLLERDESKFMADLTAEIGSAVQPRPSMAAALAEVTRRVGRHGWCTAFRWREGSVSIQLREDEELEELERTLEYSPLLGDVRQEYKKVKADMIDRKVEMNARYDLEDEQSEPPPPRETQAEPAGDGVEPDLGDDEFDLEHLDDDDDGAPAVPAAGADLRKRFLNPPPPPPPPPVTPEEEE